ncbi:hypothetical protein BJ878DRAFT_562119 [Calycina marina]|uniref:Uncharacterized protein n=1 Tax=Calycina marina TaxID=1763456 RepID=A0A9P7Z703_9HELO|nr:hypothetical protein BJ878DRAFT_562119 [Calycina marina]
MNFRAAKSDAMLALKLEIKKQLKAFNDDTIHDEDTLATLQHRCMKVAKHMMGKLGTDTNVEAPLFLKWGCQTFVDNSCYINRDVSIYDIAPVITGDKVLIAPSVKSCTDTPASLAFPVAVVQKSKTSLDNTLLTRRSGSLNI